MNRFGYYKTAVLTPPVEIGHPMANAKAIKELCGQLDPDTQLVLCPELCLSGYTCQDLFYEQKLLDECLVALEWLVHHTKENLVLIVGLPLAIRNRLYNAAAFIFNGQILGFSIKTHLPAYNEFYETRWFSSANDLPSDATVRFMNRDIPCGNDLIYSDLATGAITGIEICEDLWVANPVSTRLCANGALIIANLSASNEVISKDAYRVDLVKSQSARCYCAYLYASAGPDESSSDLVFGGQDIIAENGKILALSSLENLADCIQAEVDLANLKDERLKYKTAFEPETGHRIVEYVSEPYETIDLIRTVDAYPFVPQDEKKRIERCKQILNIQARGLATRLKKIHCAKAMIGISGGLDSTLALLVTVRAFAINHLDPEGIIAVTMPGFGTTNRTKTNADCLMEELGVTALTIPIADAVNVHFKDIGQDPSVHDITYENSQARERTQILMDLANKDNGIVIGTGDLSELALGWCTYNGDHMSMYAVNVSIPKTLVRYLVETEAIIAKEKGQQALCDTLLDICATPVSPELLPPDANGQIAQKTEEVLGKYDLHDFFLYHMLRFHEPPAKIFELACLAFPSISKEEIKKAIQTFYRRFFTQQFKRNVMPDGVKVGSVSFSPRGDWRMPSDASSALWLEAVENL